MDNDTEAFLQISSSTVTLDDVIQIIFAQADTLVANLTDANLPYLSAAITLLREVVETNGDRVTPRKRVESYWKLSTYLSARARDSESWEQDMRDAISCCETAVQESMDWPDQHRAVFTSDLSYRFLEIFRRMPDLANLQSAITQGESALELGIKAQDRQQLPTYYCNLATCYGELFRSSSDVSALDRAIELASTGVTMAKAISDSDLSLWASTLGILHHHRYMSRGYENIEIQKCLEYGELAVDSMQEGDPRGFLYLDALSISLTTQWEHEGGKYRLDRAIDLGKRAVTLAKDLPSAQVAMCNSNLSNAYRCRHRSTLNSEDLAACFWHAELAADPIHENDPQFYQYQSQLALAHRARFESGGNIADAELAISLGKAVVESAPPQHTSRPDFCTNLSTFYRSYYERSGDIHDLDNAIRYANLAIDSHAPDIAINPIFFSNLARHYYQRFNHLHDISDVREAIKHGITATRLTSKENQEFASIHVILAECYSARFGRLKERSDIEEALRLARVAVDFVTNLEDSNKISDAYALLGNLHFEFYQNYPYEHSSLDMAIQNATISLELSHHNPQSKASIQMNLAFFYFKRYLEVGRLPEDLSLAISHGTTAIDNIPEDSIDLTSAQAKLAWFYLERFRNHTLRTPDDAIKAAQLYVAVMQSEIGDPMDCLRFSRQGAEFLSSLDPRVALSTYSYTFGHLFRLVTFGSTLEARQEILAFIAQSSLSSDAASFAIDTQQYGAAVEFLEAGRSILWSQQLQLQSPFDELSEKYPELAQSLKNVAALLKHSTHSTPLIDDFISDEKLSHDLELKAQLRRQYMKEWDVLLKQVRELPDFKHFLQRPSFRELMSTCNSWPIVILNISTRRSDALVIRSHDLIEHVPLSNALFQECQRLNSEMDAILNSPGHNLRDDRHLGPKPRNLDKKLRGILERLWTLVVQPVINHLGLQKSDSPPRVWWSPTAQLSALPIHAAGIYDTAEGPNTSQFMISSYAPTLSTLKSRSTASLKFVAVGVRQGHRGSELPNAAEEIQKIQELFTSENGATPSWLHCLVDDEANVSNTIAALQHCTMLHVACHGTQDHDKPLESSLILHDNDLSLARIQAESLPDGDLVFLSACETALGDAKLRGEALHLAGVLLFAGFRRAIATLWRVNDKDCPEVAVTIYTQLTSADGEPRGEAAASALHAAILELRRKGVPLIRWVPFVHIGL